MPTILIHELAQRTGVSVRSLRHYERKHLLVAPRLPNGYRDFDESAVEHVQVIQSYLALGLTTDQIAHFLDCLLARHQPPCAEAITVYQQKLAHIDAQLAALATLRQHLHEHLQALLRTAPEPTNDAQA